MDREPIVEEKTPAEVDVDYQRVPFEFGYQAPRRPIGPLSGRDEVTGKKLRLDLE